MAGHAGTFFSRQNLATTQKQQRENLMALQGLAIGITVGMGAYFAWYYGMIASFTHALVSVTAGIWKIVHDLASTCGDLVQYVLRTANH